jgi:vacuolar-type H+-ATPase subunit I/STV1
MKQSLDTFDPSKYISNNNFTDEFSQKILGNIMKNIKSILEPVTVDYSNEVLANQIHDISIMLFVLSILIIILFIGFMINVLVSLYSDKIMNYFTNKYIR